MATMNVFNRNFPYIKQQLLALLGNTSAFVKCICLGVVVTYFLSFITNAIVVFSLTPGLFLPPQFWFWTLFSCWFFENHLWEVCVDIIIVVMCGKLLEPLWGAFEMVTFFVIVNTFATLCTCVFYLILYTFTFTVDFLFGAHIYGLSAYIAGISVAVKQIMPDHLIVKTPLGKTTNRNIPMLILLIYMALWGFGLCDRSKPIMFVFGLIVSWTYLRFYQNHTNGSTGDMADNFSFASFFPTAVQPPISVISNTVYSGLVQLRLCRKTYRKFDLSTAPTGVTVTLPGNDPQDMERRRQIALKALNERLSKVDHSQMKFQKGKGDVVVSIPAIPLPSTLTKPPLPTTVINMEPPVP